MHLFFPVAVALFFSPFSSSTFNYFQQFFILFSSSSSSMLTSQGLILATATAVSVGTIFLFDHLRGKYFPHTPQLPENQNFLCNENQSLKPCLSSGCQKNIKKKKVRFADDVKDSRGNGELYRKARTKAGGFQNSSCGNEVLGIPKMPANRAVLYSEILKHRVQRIEYSY